MSNVVVQMSMSLDGYVAGPNDTDANPEQIKVMSSEDVTHLRYRVSR